MKFRNTAIPSSDNDVWEYLLVVQPSKEINDKIVEEKRRFSSTYNHQLSSGSLPHITLACFMAKEAMEETLIRWIQNLCKLQHSFTITLNNYRAFPPHSICWRVQNTEPFNRWANALKILDGFIEPNGCPPWKQPNKPHLTMATQLPAHIYEAAAKEYSARTFHGSFEVERIALFREGDTNYNLVNTFALAPPCLID